MRNPLADKVVEIKPSGIRKFFDLANTKKGVISLGVGEPDFATPWDICEAAIYSIKSKKTHYTANAGLLSLREEALFAPISSLFLEGLSDKHFIKTGFESVL